MSNIVDANNTESLLETTSADGGLDVVGQQEEANVIEIRGDADVGIIGGQMDDVITTGAGDAAVFTGDGNDEIMGGTGGDIFRGGEGDDEIFGGIGADTLLGGEGDDILVSGRGGLDDDGNPIGDVMKGGTGNDIFRFAADEIGTGVDLITDFKDDGFDDTIRIFGVGSDADITYENGVVSVDGQDLVDIGTGQDVTIEYNEDKDSWDLF